MPTQPGGYFLDDQRIPSVSAVIAMMRDCDPLMWWAWNEGKAGRDFRDTSKRAADAGTLAHQAAYNATRGLPVEWPYETPGDVLTLAHTAFQGFQAWREQTRLTVDRAELPLISKRYRFGGTFDASLIQGKRSMADYKTAKDLYPEHLVQVAAYGQLWNENFPDDPITGGYHLLRFGKETGGFAAHWWPDLEVEWETFLTCRRLYDQKKLVKARLKG